MVLIFQRGFISIVFSLKLLQPRCDCVSVQVFYIDQQDFVLIVSNADGIQKKSLLSWNDQQKASTLIRVYTIPRF